MVVSRRGASARAPRTKFESASEHPYRRRRLRRRDGEASGRLRRSGVRRSALQSAAQGRPQASRRIRMSTPSTTTGTSSPASPPMTISPAPGCIACRRVMKPIGDDLGDRLLPQYFPRRRDHAGSRLLDPQRHRLAQDQSDAEFPRPPLHQRARDHDLGRARRQRQGLYLQLRSAEGRQRGRAGALRLADPAVHRRRAAQGRRRQEGASDAEARRPAGARACCRRRSPATWCSIRSSAPAPPAPSQSVSAAASSASNASTTYATAAEARIAAVEPLPDADAGAVHDRARRAARARSPH